MFGLENFEFTNQLPLVDWRVVLSCVAGYLLFIFGLQKWMEDRKRWELGFVVLMHNALLSVFSLVTAVGVFYELYSHVMANAASPNGVPIQELLFCDPQVRLGSGMLPFWFYLFYASKFYELLDTVIIVLKKRPIIFLHIYHHFITIVLVYSMALWKVAVSWLAISLNLTVHIFMYYYYAVSSRGIEVWWKKYITKMQIAQFFLDVFGNFVGFYYIYAGSKCSGDIEAWVFGQAILLSFLLLFMMFYKKTYTPKSPRGQNGDHAAPDSPTTGTKTSPSTIRKRIPKDKNEAF